MNYGRYSDGLYRLFYTLRSIFFQYIIRAVSRVASVEIRLTAGRWLTKPAVLFHRCHRQQRMCGESAHSRLVRIVINLSLSVAGRRQSRSQGDSDAGAGSTIILPDSPSREIDNKF